MEIVARVVLVDNALTHRVQRVYIWLIPQQHSHMMER